MDHRAKERDSRMKASSVFVLPKRNCRACLWNLVRPFRRLTQPADNLINPRRRTAYPHSTVIDRRYGHENFAADVEIPAVTR
ncbi:MAG: hypothetical protein DMF04_04665 [Verrucomicrobia bacterium]|nr:MAG: hypothetical protein DMF04_04665 [Verrucomicrobiota bacterium]